jgi:monothiol glutaredoxin
MTPTNIHTHIKNIVSNNDIVIFMKGMPSETSCGYSSRAIQVLNHCGAQYVYEDTLLSDNLRQGVKTYTGVKTLPQIFVKGDYFGGSDDLREMYETGQLDAFFEQRNITFNKSENKPDLFLSDVTKSEVKSCGKATAPRQL